MERILTTQNNKSYLSRVSDQAYIQRLHSTVGSLSEPELGNTKAFYINRHGRRQVSIPAKIPTPAQITAAIDELNPGNCDGSVFVVENIGPAYIEALGLAWKLDPAFFVKHASNKEREHLWTPSIFKDDQPRSEGKSHDFIDGTFEYHGICLPTDVELDSSPNRFHRHCFRSMWDDVETIISNTRISYYRVHSQLYLFLVDAPLYLLNRYNSVPRRIRPSLRLPYATNRGGLLLPQLLEQCNDEGIPYSIFEALKSVFKHGWHRSLLFSHDRNCDFPSAFPAPPLCYMFSNSLWRTNLQYLTREIQRISFEEIRNPDLKLNETLHDLREDLVSYLISRLSETANYVPERIETFWTDFCESSEVMQNGKQGTPVSTHRNTLEAAAKLEKLLMETFQLLMSSISVQDARMSVQQSQLSNQQALRATQLTILASIYVPLSFVTGVFGMNLKQLNGSGLSIWVFFVAIVIGAIVTAIIFLGLQVYSKQEGSRSDARKANNADMPIGSSITTSSIYVRNLENEHTSERSRV